MTFIVWAAVFILFVIFVGFGSYVLILVPRMDQAHRQRIDILGKACFYGGDVETWVEHEIWSVSVYRHALRLLMCGKWINLYGPLCQHLHWFHEGASNPRDDRVWWECYTKIYLFLSEKEQRRVCRMLVVPFNLPNILSLNDHAGSVANIYEDVERDRNSCGVGAQEYEEIMQAQDIIS